MLRDFSRSTKHCTHLSRDIRAKFDIPNLSQFLDIGENWDGGISYFRISGQSFIKENSHNPRTSDDNDTKFELETKLDKENKTTSKKMMMTLFQKLWRHCHFSNLRPIMSNPEAGVTKNKDSLELRLPSPNSLVN